MPGVQAAAGFSLDDGFGKPPERHHQSRLVVVNADIAWREDHGARQRPFSAHPVPVVDHADVGQRLEGVCARRVDGQRMRDRFVGLRAGRA